VASFELLLLNTLTQLITKMTPEDYLKSLIAGQELSSIPVQLSELKFLLTLMQLKGVNTQLNNKG
jgi:hypothetical protein